MSNSPKPAAGSSTSRPITEGITNKGGVNTNPSAALSRPAPPQPYKPQASDTTVSKPSS